MEEGDERRREAGRERERQRDEWRAAGVVTGQASCHGAPMTPCTKSERHEEEERVKPGFRGEGEGEGASWERGK